MDTLFYKALHLIFVVTWFSGLFYIVRLYIYDVEAESKPEQEKKVLQNQLRIMQKRLWYGITWPSSILTLIFGLLMLRDFIPLSDHPWLHGKLFFVLLLFLYHFYSGKIRKNLMAGTNKLSSTQLRFYNEIATIFLFAIVFLVVLKDYMSMLYGLGGLVGLSLLLVLAINTYKKKRGKS
jgi:putative membrane protein